jgi:hypothetical protein
MSLCFFVTSISGSRGFAVISTDRIAKLSRKTAGRKFNSPELESNPTRRQLCANLRCGATPFTFFDQFIGRDENVLWPVMPSAKRNVIRLQKAENWLKRRPE